VRSMSTAVDIVPIAPERLRIGSTEESAGSETENPLGSGKSFSSSVLTTSRLELGVVAKETFRPGCVAITIATGTGFNCDLKGALTWYFFRLLTFLNGCVTACGLSISRELAT
jgi:hypothetical protein